MSRLSEAQKGYIRAAVDAGREPRFTANERFTLPLEGRKRSLLVRSDGTATAAGTFWKNITGSNLPEGLDYYQEPIRKGNTEYVIIRGQERKTRTWNYVTDKFDYSRIGKLYYRNKKVEIIVDIPVLIEGRNPTSGATWERVTWLPVDRIEGLGSIGRIFANEADTPDQQMATAKQQIIAALGVNDNGRTVLNEASGETWYLRPDGQWRVSQMSTSTGGNGGNGEGPIGPTTTTTIQEDMAAFMNRNFGARPKHLHFLPLADGICSEAYSDDDGFAFLDR